MRFSKFLFLQPLCILAFAISSQAQITLYDNPFVVPGGTGSNANLALSSTVPDWYVFTGSTGELHMGAGRVFITDRPFKDAPANTYGFVVFDGAGGSPKFLWTTGQSISSTTPNLTFSWLQGNGGDGSSPVRLAIEMEGQWYASSTAFTTPGQTLANFASLTSTTAVEQSLVFSETASNWHLIDFVAGTSMALGATASHDLSGTITGFGFFTEAVSTTNNIRIADFNVTAVPEPSTYALGVIGLAVLALVARGQRRKA